MNSNVLTFRDSARRIPLLLLLGLPLLLATPSPAQSTNTPALLRLQAGQTAAKISPMLYGLMTEEINYSYEGGLYAELVRNRTFKWNATNAVYWRLVQPEGAAVTMSLDTNQPLNEALDVSLKLEVTQATTKAAAGIANEGFWGIPVHPNTKYRASFYARAAAGFTGSLTVAIVSTNGSTEYSSARVKKITDQWQKYEVTLKTGKAEPTKDAVLRITTDQPGTVWFSLVSLFPPTYKNRPNGNRPDIMQLLADLNPSFLRFPGGNYLEGNTIATRFDWKKTIGDVSQRPGHPNDAWHYWSTDGMGLLEFLGWCEDLNMEPVLALYAGYSLHQERIAPGPELEPYVQDALDEIEYVTGDAKSTKWGACRAQDGHPAPFKLRYVEIGNEDFFDRGTNSYEGRFAQFHAAIKAKYPGLQTIATMKVTNTVPDVIDDHFYRRSMEMQADTHHYDKTDRHGPKIFVGEWATREGSPTPNMNAALGDAAWMTGLERNSDIVIMHCYAPLFVNVSPGAMQWRTDLIGYDALNSYGSPAYYAQVMFSQNHGDAVLPMTVENLPTREWQPPPRRRRRNEDGPPPEPPPPQQVPTLFYNATRDSKSGTVFLKLVNTASTPQAVQLEIQGARIKSKGSLIEMSSDAAETMNSIAEPRKVAPITTKLDSLGNSFTRTLPAYSISVLVLDAK